MNTTETHDQVPTLDGLALDCSPTPPGCGWAFVLAFVLIFALALVLP